MTRGERITSMVAALVAATVACGQWNFPLDPSFQTEITQQNVNSLLLNEDGTLIASGIMRFPGEFSDKRLVRLLPNGVRDESFYNSGLGGTKLISWQDRFYVGTNAYPRRILATGYQDPTFIGLNLGPYFSSLQGGDYHVYPDGRVLISGRHMLSDSIRGFEGPHNLIWFSNTGYLDTTKTHRKGTGCTVYRFEELPNGQFICSGTCNEFEGQEVDWIFRVNDDGSPDTSFRTGVYIGSVADYLPLLDGRVYVAGNFRRTQAPQDTLRLVRFLLDGELDPSFSIPQFSLGSVPGVFGSYGLSVQYWLDGNLLVTGKFQYVNGLPRRGICLLDTTGAVLPAFAEQGIGPYVYQGITYASIQSVAYDTANAQLYICGPYNGYDDGPTNDPDQRFVTRLNVQEINTSTQQVNVPPGELEVWPNPSDGYVVLNYAVPGNASALQLRIRDAQGRVVHSVQTAGEEGQQLWDTRGVAPGVYSVELLRGGQLERTERLVIQP